jgi:hypothetical protein
MRIACLRYHSFFPLQVKKIQEYENRDQQQQVKRFGILKLVIQIDRFVMKGKEYAKIRLGGRIQNSKDKIHLQRRDNSLLLASPPTTLYPQ